MSGIDRAFIKVFRKDPAQADVAVPHGNQRMETPPYAAVPPATPSPPQTAATDATHHFAHGLAAGPSAQGIPTKTNTFDAPHNSATGPHWSMASPTMAEASAVPTSPAATLPEWARPAYAVEQFAWPEVCRQLVSSMGGQLDAAAKMLLDRSRIDKKIVFIGSVGRGEGCTTVLLCLAQRLASIGVNCALVDADFERPSLVQSLGVSPAVGWEDVVREQHGIAEVMIQSDEDHLAVLPLRSAIPDARLLANDLHWPATMATLKQHYQVVLVDGPPAMSQSASTLFSLGSHLGIDSAILVSSQADAMLPELTNTTGQFAAAGVEVLGVVENLCTVAGNSLHGRTSTALSA